jgi:uncharacterized protein YukE
MLTVAQTVAKARALAQEMQLDMHLEEGVYSGHFWNARVGDEDKVRARAIAGLDFLDRHAGPQSQWARRGHNVFDRQGQTIAQAAHALSEVVAAWADQVEDGMVPVFRIETQGLRAVASTDLMEQVRKLNEDNTVHPAAPIVLAGAALELALRSAVDEMQLNLPQGQRPSISSYAGCLRSANAITRQDAKDIESIGGIRNEAAHGHFASLDSARAGLVEQQVNMTLRRLADLIDDSTDQAAST